uniref:Uncharacterized protein n=1 Tax=Glossina pallidipes TaxID=7398 RepID=A0A1A9Z8F2_GLOPL
MLLESIQKPPLDSLERGRQENNGISGRRFYALQAFYPKQTSVRCTSFYINLIDIPQKGGRNGGKESIVTHIHILISKMQESVVDVRGRPTSPITASSCRLRAEPRFCVTPHSTGMNLHKIAVHKRLRQTENSPVYDQQSEKTEVVTSGQDGHQLISKQSRALERPQILSISPVPKKSDVAVSMGNRTQRRTLASLVICGFRYVLRTFAPSAIINLWSSASTVDMAASNAITIPSEILCRQITENFEKQIRKFSNSELFGSDAARFIGQLNEIFLGRLQHIDKTAPNNADLRLTICQEWVDILLKITESLVKNTEQMELEMSKRLNNVQYNVGSHHGQGNELLHYRKDLNTLVKVIRNAYHNRCWDFQGIDLVTTSRSQVLGIHGATGQDLRNKGGSVGLEESENSLAAVVAEKQREIEKLKQKLNSVEGEMRNAKKTIQLKERLIKELIDDLKNTNLTLTKTDIQELLSETLKFLLKKS